MLVKPSTGDFRFAHRRLTGFAAAGLTYHYQVSSDLTNWHDATAVEERITPLAASPGYEAVTLSLPPAELAGHDRVFLKIAANP